MIFKNLARIPKFIFFRERSPGQKLVMKFKKITFNALEHFHDIKYNLLKIIVYLVVIRKTHSIKI